MHQAGDWCKLRVSCVIITDIAPVVILSSLILGSSLFSSPSASFSQLHVPKLVASHAVCTTELEARQGAAWPSAQPYGCRWPSCSMASARHLVEVCVLSIMSVYQISSVRDTFEKERRNAKHSPQPSRPPIAIMMSLIAAWRQGKETEKVPLANIDSRFVSFGEHAAVRAPLSRPNLLKRSSGHPRSPVMLFTP